MGKKVTLGGDRLGSGKKMAVELKNFGRSSHNVGCIIATDQAAGTLVPYYCDIATNGTTYYIDMATKVRALPTNGPVFGSFKHQLDWFVIPIRLYIRALHNNALNIGMKMQNVYLPRYSMGPLSIGGHRDGIELNTKFVDQSSLSAYIGVRGHAARINASVGANFPANFLLAYWDIYKCYYANKQEEEGVVIQGTATAEVEYIDTPTPDGQATYRLLPNVNYNPGVEWSAGDRITLKVAPKTSIDKVRAVKIAKQQAGGVINYMNLIGNGTTTLQFGFDSYDYETGTAKLQAFSTGSEKWIIPAGQELTPDEGQTLKLTRFPLTNIDDVREAILAAPKTSPFYVPSDKLPYSTTASSTSQQALNNIYPNAGLGIKTYLSDRFNNWLSTEWIEGNNGINDITAIDVSSGELKMDSLILQKKVFNMLNRIAVTDGTYDAWQEAVYGVRAIRMAETPIYCGGMSSEITFDEVVSNSATEEQPLGSLAGRGTDHGRKGGKAIKIKIEEPSMIMCIGSITPRVMYSQGNKWWTRLKTMNDLHKPDLDAIAWQDLLTDEMYAATTDYDANDKPSYKAIGKQPAWIEYMTRVNESFGSFSAGEPLDWMVLNRVYNSKNGKLTDATTYIDPTMYNVAFADTKLSARNFWVQVAFDITARRVMSAHQIPNL